MSDYRPVVEGVWQIGGSPLTDPRDAAIYLVDGGSSLALVDSGAGASVSDLEGSLSRLGLSPQDVEILFLTHCHIDHVGGAAQIQRAWGSKLAVHELDAPFLTKADAVATAALWYGIELEPLEIDLLLTQEDTPVTVGHRIIRCLHTPGHTPGSLTLLLEHPEGRVLFAQDVHGPFLEEFQSDLAQWEGSMRRLLALDAEFLCEGHYGVFRGRKAVRRFIESHLRAQGFAL